MDHRGRAGELLRAYGVRSVVTSRFLPVVRVLTPVAAGSARFPYRRFLPASLAGALLWAVVHVAAGAFAGASLRAIDQTLGALGWVLLGVVALALGVWWRHHRRRSR